MDSPGGQTIPLIVKPWALGAQPKNLRAEEVSVCPAQASTPEMALNNLPKPLGEVRGIIIGTTKKGVDMSQRASGHPGALNGTRRQCQWPAWMECWEKGENVPSQASSDMGQWEPSPTPTIQHHLTPSWEPRSNTK